MGGSGCRAMRSRRRCYSPGHVVLSGQLADAHPAGFADADAVASLVDGMEESRAEEAFEIAARIRGHWFGSAGKVGSEELLVDRGGILRLEPGNDEQHFVCDGRAGQEKLEVFPLQGLHPLPDGLRAGAEGGCRLRRSFPVVTKAGTERWTARAGAWATSKRRGQGFIGNTVPLHKGNQLDQSLGIEGRCQVQSG